MPVLHCHSEEFYKNCVGALPPLRQRDRRQLLWSLARGTSRKPPGDSAAPSSAAPLQLVVAVQSTVLG